MKKDKTEKNNINIELDENVSQGTYSNLVIVNHSPTCLLYTSPSPRDRTRSRMPSSA